MLIPSLIEIRVTDILHQLLYCNYTAVGNALNFAQTVIITLSALPTLQLLRSVVAIALTTAASVTGSISLQSQYIYRYYYAADWKILCAFVVQDFLPPRHEDTKRKAVEV
ncbi:hypothetical protein NIES4103_08150 [Nostoc sp. NIES-4103]|nr:hypothetical protein NIES4103_08150 [Nostoc sp. NIES-4103]